MKCICGGTYVQESNDFACNRCGDEIPKELLGGTNNETTNHE